MAPSPVLSAILEASQPRAWLPRGLYARAGARSRGVSGSGATRPDGVAGSPAKWTSGASEIAFIDGAPYKTAPGAMVVSGVLQA